MRLYLLGGRQPRCRSREHSPVGILPNASFAVALILFSAVVLLATACSADPQALVKPRTLTAIKVNQVSLDSAASFWSNAPKLQTPTKPTKQGAADGPTVTLQAVYDGKEIAIRAEWADPTESIVKRAWVWDGSKFTSRAGDEDRLQFLWPIGNDAEFASKGCTAACHTSDPDSKKWWMGSAKPGKIFDDWHWKAARTNPFEQSDDAWWGDGLSNPNDFESGRHSDKSQSGGAARNQNKEGTGPQFANGKEGNPFIFKGEEAPLDVAKLTSGAVVPGYVINKMDGSRGNIAARGKWADGKWVVVIKRALNTGNEDDAVFNPPKPLPFGFAVVNDGGGLDHTVSPDVLTLEWN